MRLGASDLSTLRQMPLPTLRVLARARKEGRYILLMHPASSVRSLSCLLESRGYSISLSTACRRDSIYFVNSEWAQYTGLGVSDAT